MPQDSRRTTQDSNYERHKEHITCMDKLAIVRFYGHRDTDMDNDQLGDRAAGRVFYYWQGH